ncbi:MAG: hypothetical protein EOO13_12410, partial [Chitinophagaceae bacterium]
MNVFQKISILFFVLFTVAFSASAQQLIVTADSTVKKKKKAKVVYDSTYNPNVAVRRSLILPGWGQITNKKYWKAPIVWGALGTTTVIFFRNLSQYRDAKQAYIFASDTILNNDQFIKEPYYS